MPVISDDNVVKSAFLLPADIISLLIPFFTLPTLAVFFWQRLQSTPNKRLTVANFTCLLTYSTTFLFILVISGILHFRLRPSQGLCDATMLLCIVLRSLAKLSELLCLIERAYIIKLTEAPRYKTCEYVLSYLIIFVPYIVLTEVMIRFRYTTSIQHDLCVVGIRMWALIAQLVFETAAQLYLTLCFLWPLIAVHCGGNGLLLPLRRVVIRTFIGSSITLLSNFGVRIPLALFNGEPTWLCALTCKVDAFFAACVLHWMTKPIYCAKGSAEHPALGVGFEVVTEDGSSGLVQFDLEQEVDLKDILAWCVQEKSVNRTQAT